MIGYLKPPFKEMPRKVKFEYRSIYCGLCRALKTKYGSVGVACLGYEVTTFLILALSLQEKKQVFHGSCSMTPFLRVPFVNYLSAEFDNAAAISILIADYEILDNMIDEKSLKWTIANKLLHERHKKAQHFLGEQYEQINKAVLDYFSIENRYRTDFKSVIEASGKMAEVIMGPLFLDCKKEHGKILMQLANGLGQWIYLLDACDDWLSDKEKNLFNPINLLSDKLSVCQIISSIQQQIVCLLSELPIEHYKDLITYILVDNLYITGSRILGEFEKTI